MISSILKTTQTLKYHKEIRKFLSSKSSSGGFLSLKHFPPPNLCFAATNMYFLYNEEKSDIKNVYRILHNLF